jgi:hypothetical protein
MSENFVKGKEYENLYCPVQIFFRFLGIAFAPGQVGIKEIIAG